MKLFLIALTLLSLLATGANAEPAAKPSDTSAPGVSDDASAARDAHIEEAVLMLLSQHHRAPTLKQLEGLTPRARYFVERIARDEDAFAFHRERALIALGYWADDATFNYLAGLLDNPQTDESLLHTLLPLLANSFGERAVGELTPFVLEHDNVQVRISAAAALGRLNSDEAFKILDIAIEQEPNPIARQRIEDAAARLR
ncbi:hypothetical protein EA187_00360 [Lujinxingia sediminis]|uniref:HEAT repeat domain-containing protein n=1 Tax=Lujinxingia sediminis TaxID=2480984 RepID=A0ABY0CVN5_9DELT|nr:hypothetical protein [Lujinxingia sediminis]RVU47924.1 hypothetical protein EA187_00360 [Lujinxingia sediminis]